ncbi:hypothetical protein QQM39_11555 [Streptomyces sp. DT2A-34]|uniref:hypothetical protein n=1 Tax=Streptomyces sp. DT2A-34 TaxID=3051182 RepID=UPI00265C3EA1|nr:hypothetical protein [Streptomyces sp. DT2A-34]MDO0911465.1 hypothetical protein [Streptomyces sp. DT2A-34]
MVEAPVPTPRAEEFPRGYQELINRAEPADTRAGGGLPAIFEEDRAPLLLGEEGEARPAERAVTVRCLVAEGGAVPDADDGPGNVAVVARAY